MKTMLRSAVMIGCVMLVGQSVSESAEPTVYDQILVHYEAVRQALLQDSVEGIGAHARAIRKISEEFDASKAAIDPVNAASCEKLLAAARQAAADLAATKTLVDARESFGRLSEHLIEYQRMSKTADSIVVYCSMADKSWLQPAGAIGNPYVGQSMSSCGEIVAD